MAVYYTEEHEWISVEGDVATAGITDHAQNLLGDIVYVRVPEVGREFAKGDEAAIVESVKAASDVFAPVSGTVIESNMRLAEASEGGGDEPALVNSDPEGEGWFFRLRLADPSQLDGLMDADSYKAFTDAQ
jgi:glycine cleavage system H protein